MNITTISGRFFGFLGLQSKLPYADIDIAVFLFF